MQKQTTKLTLIFDWQLHVHYFWRSRCVAADTVFVCEFWFLVLGTLLPGSRRSLLSSSSKASKSYTGAENGDEASEKKECM